MQATSILFTNDGRSHWAGYSDFLLVSPDGNHTVEIKYEGEPPHGDSYHSTRVDGRHLPGFAWGCLFGFSECSRYAVFSWMSKLIERRTIAVDMDNACYFVLPEYIYAFHIEWPTIIGEGLSEGKSYTFTGLEEWCRF